MSVHTGEAPRGYLENEGITFKRIAADGDSRRVCATVAMMEKNHSELLAKLIEMDGRIVRLETQRLIQ